MNNSKISLLIVDDSALMRNLITKMFDDVPDIHVAGTAMNGKFALKKLETLKPDVIILDLEMPEMNGIEFLKEREKRGIDIPVIILSSLAKKGAKITMEALSLGASDFVLKPSGSISLDIHKTKDQLVELIRAYGGQYKKKRGETPPSSYEKIAQVDEKIIDELRVIKPKEPVPSVQEVKRAPIEIVAIGISTGGPNALRKVLPHLSSNLPTPVVIVQHMPAGFTKEFAESLNKICPLNVKEAEEGDTLERGKVFIAPGDKHMEVETGSTTNRIRLTNDPPVNGHRPSVDVLFKSVAKVYARRSLAVIMTGMGKDGAKEIGRIYSMGGITIAQDEKTSIVYGMPRVAIESGVIHHVLPLEKIADKINELTLS